MSTTDFPVDPKIEALVARFPRLFKGQHPRVWSDLPQGWTEVADQLFADLDAMLDDDAAKLFEVIQIKEKFAGLRVYWELGKEQTTVMDFHAPGAVQRVDEGPAKPTVLFERIRDRVKQAGEEAATTCQRCGNGGASAGGRGWIMTLCEACRAKQDLEGRKGRT
jgi:hypothetical protein